MAPVRPDNSVDWQMRQCRRRRHLVRQVRTQNDVWLGRRGVYVGQCACYAGALVLGVPGGSGAVGFGVFGRVLYIAYNE